MIDKSSDFKRGYQWAKKGFEEEHLTRDEIEAFTDGAIRYNDFDRGANEYLRETGDTQ